MRFATMLPVLTALSSTWTRLPLSSMIKNEPALTLTSFWTIRLALLLIVSMELFETSQEQALRFAVNERLELTMIAVVAVGIPSQLPPL